MKRAYFTVSTGGMQATLPPNYKAVSKIPKGGLTELTIAQDDHGRKVVIRAVASAHKRDRALNKHFKNSISLLATIDHPNIIHLLDHGKHAGRRWMAVEYHENLNLRDHISRRSTTLTEHAYPLIFQLADALTYLHAAHILHLDLKPENLLIKDDKTLILVDFDLAVRHKNKALKPRKVSGTPAYLAPETLTDHLMDEQTEIFSFGLTAYELLTGHKPFDFKSIGDYHRLIVAPNALPRPMKDFRPDISRRLESIILKCLAKNRGERYPAIRLVRRDLEAML